MISVNAQVEKTILDVIGLPFVLSVKSEGMAGSALDTLDDNDMRAGSHVARTASL